MRFILFLLLTVSILFAEVAKVSAVIGDASILRNGKTIKIIIGTKLEKKDIILTKNNSKLQIIFKDNTIITLGKNSALDISEYIYDTKNPKHSQTNLNFFKGAFKAITGNIGKINKEKFKLRTKSSTIGIRGTVIIGNQNMIACTQGSIIVTSSGNSVLVNANQVTYTKENQPPSNVETITSSNLETLEKDIEPIENSNSSKEQDSTINKKVPSSEENSNEKVKKEDTSIERNKDGNTQGNLFVSSETNIQTTKDINSIIENVNEDSLNKNLEVPVPITYSLKGKFLGGNLDNILGSYIQKNYNFDGQRIDSVFSFNSSLLRSDGSLVSVNSSKEFTNFDNVVKGGYIKFNQRNEVVPFNYTNSLNGDYTIFTDNMGEVFIGFYDGIQTQNASTGVVDKDFNEFFILGTQGDTSTFDNSKVYIYKDFKDLKIEKNNSGNIINSSLNSGDGYLYYNSSLNSMTHFNKDFYNKGAKEFTFGTKSKAISYYNKYDFSYTSPYTTNSITTSKSVANLNFYGIDLQAISYDLNTDTKKIDYSSGVTVTTNTNQEILGVSLLDNKSSNAKSTGSYTLDGYIKGSSYGNSYHEKDTSENLSIKVDRDNGLILSNSNIIFNFGSDNAVLKLNGEIASETAYYISDDLFGAMFVNGDTVYTKGVDDFDLVDNSGYLMAIPDGGFENSQFKMYDSNDNPIMSDDESSWGYWTSNFSDGTDEIFIDPFSTWVAGTITPSSVVQNLIDNTSNSAYFFEGKVLGNVLLNSGTNEIIKVDDSNILNLQFNLGGGLNNMEGSTMRFSTDSTSWNLNLNSTNVNSSGFSGNFGTSGSGTYNGKFYGTDSIKSVGGVFDVTNSSNDVANGVFKAIKK